jgi:O-methyltransferase/aklanonic acid methyltransferase
MVQRETARKERCMARIWSRPIGVASLDGPDYWDYFGFRLVEHAAIAPGARVLDVGCGTGSSLFPAAEVAGPRGYATGIDICPG